MIRVGFGYDVHRLEVGRELYLCGEKIEYEKGLLGHSDADVALHALCDALLGAAALGDIGKHFPDTDERYKGISSIILLKNVMALIRENGYNAVNGDITIVAQAPKIAPYIEKMRENVADAMGINKDFISVKATTTEKLGFEGRGEGISAAAAVLIEK
ncbi:MAG: 2-C-methyl-D-erythritol 2,4-cyclodiphosphate synthase [Clostridia bacterium]|nr:2-C-methyl-D-erythritol 2,4-cyclodiphosphate synthase [Clostridia bacterium]